MGSRMSLLDGLNQFLVGSTTFPALNYAMNRKRILSRYRQLLRTETLSQDALRAQQLQRLREVARYCLEWIPFYTRRFKEIGFAPEDIKSLEDVRHIAPLLRQDVIDHRIDLVDTRYRECLSNADRSGAPEGSPSLFAGFRRRTLVRNCTSGSSGTPTQFYEDGSTTALNWVHELRLKRWFGMAPGVKEARMFLTAAEYATKGGRPTAREVLWNQTMLPGYFLSEREYEICVRKIRKFKPRVLWGHTPALMGLAQYVQLTSEDISNCRPDLVISRAAPLYQHEKSLLAEVFGCPITNIYGTRELGHVAMMCPHGSFHVNQENYIVEIEEHASGKGTAGPGTVLVTPLYETPMPFLRYRLGDVAELGGSGCPCGRSLTMLKKILGRSGEMFQTRDGRTIEPNFWCIAFESGRQRRDVERFQVVYHSQDLIRMRIVRRPTYSAETESDLRSFIDANFPSNIRFEFEYVPEIKPEASGKYRCVVNESEWQKDERVLV